MKNQIKKGNFSLNLIITLMLLMMIAPLAAVLLGFNILKELIILFWILLLMNFLSLIITTINRLSNNILVNKVYNHIFNTLYSKDIYIDTTSNETLIKSITNFFKLEKDKVNFKFEKIRLKEIVDSSYETSSFPLLTIFFTLLYTISIYNNTNIEILNFKTDIIFVILNSVLLFTFAYILTYSYLKIRVSLCNLCLNVIKEYELDK